MSYSVCIVDDEQFILDGITSRLQNLSLDISVVGTATNAVEAHANYLRYHPDIYFVDITMPGMTGLELIDLIRKDDPDTRTKFVIVSGYYDFSYLQKSIRLGVSDYLKKPIDEKEFLQTMQKLCTEIDQEKFLSVNVRIIHWMKYLSGEYEERLNSETKLLIRSEKLSLQINSFLHRIEALVDFVVDFSGADNILLLSVKHPEDRFVAISLLKAIDEGLQCVIADTKFQNRSDMINYLESNLNMRYCSTACLLKYNAPENTNKFIKISLDDLEKDLLNDDSEKSRLDINLIFTDLAKSADTSKYIGEYFRNCIIMIGMFYAEHGLSVPSSIRYALLPFYVSRFSHLSDLIEYIDASINQYCYAVQEKSRHSELIDNVASYIDSHYSEDISLKSIASEFFLTPTYLTRKFSEKKQLTIVQYIENVRIQNAIRLLRTTDLSITDISSHVGYSDSSYFTRVFKKCTGMSPKDARQRGGQLKL